MHNACFAPAEARKEEPDSASGPCVAEWRAVAPGIDYKMHGCDLHLVRIDPRVAKISALAQKGTTAQQIGDSALFAINANFFDEKYDPLGVVMSNRNMLNPVHPVSWQSVFYVTRDGKAAIVPVPDWRSVRDQATTAVQAGPRLTVGGKRNGVARAKPDLRSGVCLSGSHVIFFATPSNRAIDVWKAADFAMALGCRDSMLFDGGPSVQLYVRVPGAPVSIEGDPRVPAFVVVKP